TCPYFEDHGVCKHLVAVLCAVDAQWNAATPDGLQPFVIGDAVSTIQEPGVPSAAASGIDAQPRWRQRLEAIAAEQQSGHADGALPVGAEVMYILDPEGDHRGASLAVEVGYRVPLRDGRWSVVKRFDFGRQHLPLLPTEQDRNGMAILMGSPTDAYYYGYDHFSTQSRPFNVPDAAQRVLFDFIGPTGRCYLRHNGQKDDLQPLRWDDGPPWRPRLDVKAAEPDGDYRLDMVLRRGEHAMNLHEPDLITGGGVMVHGGVLSRVEMDRPGQAGWLRAERSSAQARLRSRGDQTDLTIPRREAGEMLEQLLSIPDLPEMSLPDELDFDRIQGSPAPSLHVHSPPIGHWDQRLQAEMRVGYADAWLGGDDPRLGIFDPAGRTFTERDTDAEDALLHALLDAGLKPETAYNREHDWLFTLQPKHLTAVATSLTESGWRVVADGKPYRAAASLNLSVNSGIDWFELHGQATFGEQTAALPELLKAMQSGSRTVLLDDGSQGLLPEDWLKRYGMLGAFGKAQDDHLRFELPQTMLLDAMLAELPGVDIDRQFKRVRERIERAGKAKPKAPPRGFKGELRPYQRDGLGWMHQLNRVGLGGCLADDMGLGKTVQVLAMLESRRAAKPTDRPEHPTLIVVPRSLIFNWTQEAKRFTPNLALINYTGNQRFEQLGIDKATLNTEEAGGPLNAALHDYDAVLTTYGTLRRDIALFKDCRFDYAILDEAQAIKNANSATAKAARLLRADHRLALSGTPIENHLGELWSLFAYLNPGMLGRGKLAKQLQSNSNQTSDETKHVLSKALRPYILRRTKQQVATDLPDKTEQTLYCELSNKQRKHYNQLRDHYRDQLLKRIDTQGLAKSKIQVLEALLRLRQAACHPALIDPEHKTADSAKLDQLLEQLQAVLDEGHKALVFSQFTQFLGLVRERLESLDIDYAYLDGKTRKRQDKVDRFQDDPDCKLFLITLKAGGTGLNLTAADYVFLLDPWWNPAVEAQAIDRAHRIGQDKHVFAYRLIAKDTVEEKVLELQQTKRDLADAILSQDNAALRDLTREDLERLLG
ncbi:MAG: SNF2-related protein, partial [Phycisphaeraceae bacterium]